MNEEKVQKKKMTKKKGNKNLLKKLGWKNCLIIVLVAAIIALVTGGIITFRNWESNESTAKTVGFKDIGELATQEAYVTVVQETKNARQVFGKDFPFTESQLVYSYAFTVKAGFEFSDIIPEIDEENKTITIDMPEVKILSNEMDEDSFKAYVEDESIFNNIKLEQHNEAYKEMKQKAIQTATDGGMYDSAKQNAEALIKSFLKNEYPEDNGYKYTFNYAGD